MTRALMAVRLGGDEELIGQLIGLFVAECPRMLDEVRRAVERGCADEIRSAAHAFKGSVSNFTAGGAFVAARALEAFGRDGELAEAPAAFARLEQEVDGLLRVMCQVR